MTAANRKIERIQTGVRIEKRVLKVLKAIAARNEMGWEISSKELCCTVSRASPLSVQKRWRSSSKCDPPMGSI